MINLTLLVAQEKKAVFDTILVQKDSVVVDTLLRKSMVSPDAIDKTITHTCSGYRRTDFINKRVYLVDKAIVTYGDINLTADSIVLNMDTGEVFATGKRDSTGHVAGYPVFKQGEEQFESKALFYNFKTKKGRVIDMMTEQEDGYLRSKVTKKLNDGSLNINRSTYSTCDHDPPHFYVGFNRAKVIPGKKIITGPAYMVLEDIPLPVIIPFGFFPIQKKKMASGILIPKIGQSSLLGYSLRDGGYYFAISDNFDLSLLGTLYTNGSYSLSATSKYVRRYKYQGNFSLSFANNITGHKGLPDYSKENNYRIDWNYTQDPKARPGSTFSARVSMSSGSFDKKNSYNMDEHITSQRQSSISYSKTWTGTPFNFATSLNHSQNMRTRVVNLNLPKASFNMARIYPLKRKNQSGSTKWYQELQFQYSASVDNQITTTDSMLFTKSVFNNMRNGFKHEAPLSIAIRPFKKLSSFTISPQISYSGVVYTRKYEQTFVPDFYNPTLNKTLPTIIKDTINGIFYGQSVTASIGAGISPQIIGIYEFKNQNLRIKKVMHLIKPSIGFSYAPYLRGLTTDMYRQVQIDTAGRTKQYSIFEGNIYGTPSLPTRSGGITFSLINIVEAKIMEKNDTTGKPKKVKIIDNLAANTSYNIFLDSLRWAPVTMNYRATLFQNVGFVATGAFSMYGMDKNGKTINTFYYSQTGKLLRMTAANLSIDLDLAKLFQKKEGKGENNQQKSTAPVNAYDEEAMTGDKPGAKNNQDGMLFDEYGYQKFDMPWSLSLSYSFMYSKPALNSVISQGLTINGSLTLTKKTSMNFRTGLDIQRMEITPSSISINRDLHCWDMSFEWIPVGYMKSWFFTIRVKASVLADLKYERRKDFHDQY
ncbi:MAG: putative LPS assembly protein LptD [Bacteroidales bacterium]